MILTQKKKKKYGQNFQIGRLREPTKICDDEYVGWKENPLNSSYLI